MNAPFDDSKEDDVAKPNAEGTAKRKRATKPEPNGAKPAEDEGYTRETHAEKEQVAPGLTKTDTQWIDKNLPTWGSYLRRLGFEVKSFRRGVISEPGERYRKTIAKATLLRDGSVKCTPDDYKPTDKEAEGIAEEYKKAELPRSVRTLLSAAKAKARELENEGEGRTAFILQDVDGKHALMIHLRVEKGFDGKDYWPWTYWNDGKWRQMEPSFDDYPEDTPIPLYGLECLRPIVMAEVGKRRLRVMIHEGAKPAAFVQRMLADPKLRAKHPLAEELDRYEHMGWIGGATNWDRTNFEPLKSKAKGRELVFVADNDTPGENAIPRISELMRLPMKVVRFDDYFEEGFDLAEEWPDNKDWWKVRGGARVYTGPRLRDLMRPATWATDTVRTGKQGRPSYRLRSHFAKEWMKSTKPEVFFNVEKPHDLLTPEEFSSAVDPFSSAKDTAALLSKHYSSSVESVDYLPGEKSGCVVVHEGKHVFNTYRGTDIEPLAGDIEMFMKFMEKLIPDEKDRLGFLRWIATLVARPDIRMHYSVLLISETQGVGKTTLAEILAALVGIWNASFPSETMLVESQFNMWQAHKRLVIVNEIYAGHSTKAYNKLKGAITDLHVTANPKNRGTYEMDNHVHIFASSNSKNALGLPLEDRRWFIPGVTEIVEPPQYWKDFYAWLEAGGLRIILWWAREFVKTPENVVQKGDRPPDSAAKQEVIAEGRFPDEQLTHEFAEIVLARKEKIVVAVKAWREFVAYKFGKKEGDVRVAKEHRMRKWLVSAGLQEPKGEGRAKRFLLTTVGSSMGGSQTVFSTVVANFPIEEGAEAKDLVQFLRKPEDLWPM